MNRRDLSKVRPVMGSPSKDRACKLERTCDFSSFSSFLNSGVSCDHWSFERSCSSGFDVAGKNNVFTFTLLYNLERIFTSSPEVSFT